MVGVENILFALFALLFTAVLTNGDNPTGNSLGKLHWCDTLCLCHDDTNEKLHCFTSIEIYSLVHLKGRELARLQRTDFDVEKKLMWCSDTCLCHKNGKKQFRCIKAENWELITQLAPHLATFMEDEVELIDDGEAIKEQEDIISITAAPEEDRGHKGKKKGKKHRKNKKKHQQQDENIVAEILPTTEFTTRMSTPPYQWSSPRDDPKSQPIVHQAGGFYAPKVSQPTPKFESQMDKVDILEKIESLQFMVINLHQKVEDNFRITIFAIALGLGALLFIGLVVLSICICCRNRFKKTSSKSKKSKGSNSDEKNLTKVNISEAW